MKTYDYIVIGGGSGGIASANRAGMHGANVLLIGGNRNWWDLLSTLVVCLKSHVASQQHDGNDGKRYSRLRV